MKHDKHKTRRKSKIELLKSLIKQQGFDMSHNDSIKQHRDNRTNRLIRAGEIAT